MTSLQSKTLVVTYLNGNHSFPRWETQCVQCYRQVDRPRVKSVLTLLVNRYVFWSCSQVVTDTSLNQIYHSGKTKWSKNIKGSLFSRWQDVLRGKLRLTDTRPEGVHKWNITDRAYGDRPGQLTPCFPFPTEIGHGLGSRSEGILHYHLNRLTHRGIWEGR